MSRDNLFGIDVKKHGPGSYTVDGYWVENVGGTAKWRVVPSLQSRIYMAAKGQTPRELRFPTFLKAKAWIAQNGPAS